MCVQLLDLLHGRWILHCWAIREDQWLELFIYNCLCSFAQLGPTLSLPGSSVHGIFHARILEHLPSPFPSPRDLPNTERETMLPALQAVSLPLHRLESPWNSFSSVQFSSVAQSCLTLCDPMNCSTLGLPVHHQLPEFTQTHVHRVSDAIQPSHPLSSPSPPAPNPSQHQGLFQRANSSHEVAKYWSFSFNISPSNEHPGLISFRMDSLDLLAVQGTLKSLLQHHSSKAWTHRWSKLHSYLQMQDYDHLLMRKENLIQLIPGKKLRLFGQVWRP